METVKISWSGGKDSTCATHLHLLKGHNCIICNYMPMFDDETPLLLKNHYEFIMETAERFRKMGGVVHIVHGITYWDFVMYERKKGINKGKVQGFPFFWQNKCNFQRDSKTKSIKNLDKDLGLIYDYEDIGLAVDEKHRLAQLTEKKRSILCEEGYTEKMAFEYCRDNNLLSPHYQNFKRDGCALCPQANVKERIRYLQEYPSVFEKILYLQEVVKRECPNRYPLRGHKWIIEESNQLNIFGDKFIIN